MVGGRGWVAVVAEWQRRTRLMSKAEARCSAAGMLLCIVSKLCCFPSSVLSTPSCAAILAGAYDAQDFAKAHAKELGMETVPSLNVVFTEERG